MNIPVKLFNEYATLPTRAHPTDAGLDLYAAWSAVIPSRQWRRVKTGIGGSGA